MEMISWEETWLLTRQEENNSTRVIMEKGWRLSTLFFMPYNSVIVGKLKRSVQT